MILPTSAYVTMPGKKTETYIKVIEALKSTIKPITTDLSIAPYFPEVVLIDLSKLTCMPLYIVYRESLTKVVILIFSMIVNGKTVRKIPLGKIMNCK